MTFLYTEILNKSSFNTYCQCWVDLALCKPVAIVTLHYITWLSVALQIHPADTTKQWKW